MTRKFDGDPADALRRVDPLDRLDAPHDTTGAHARALFQEVIEMDTMERPAPEEQRQPIWRRWALVATAVAVIAATVASFSLLGNDTEEEAIVGGEPVGGAMAMCIQYDEATLLGLSVAFDGTVVETTRTTATFEVHRWFKGGEGDRITLSAEGLVAEESVALLGITLQVGQRYLAAGADGFVWGCGYTVTYDTEIANHWEEIFSA
jgi:hypothetical protein